MQAANQQNQNANLAIYNQVRSVPADALSPIEGGPMKGKSNINPQWRLERLTGLFGCAGLGWKVEQVSRWTEATGQGEVAVFCEVNLYVKQGEQWSQPIFGQGGSMLVRRSAEWVNGVQQEVLRIDDEAYKKAYTDAISVACKALGIAADVYYAQDETKYGSFRKDSSKEESIPADTPAEVSGEWPWNKAFQEIKPGAPNWKASVTQVSKMADCTKDEILARISAKFNITRENFDELLRVANHVAAA